MIYVAFCLVKKASAYKVKVYFAMTDSIDIRHMSNARYDCYICKHPYMSSTHV